MAVAVGRGFLVQLSSSSSFLRKGHTHFGLLNQQLLDFIRQLLLEPSSDLHGSLGSTLPPPNGTLAGDFGFDPLGLGEDSDSLKWYVQAELVHARFAMAGVAGILFTDLLRVTGISNLPVWYEAGAVKFDFASTRTLFIQLLLMGFVETKRFVDFISPGSQAKEGTFF